MERCIWELVRKNCSWIITFGARAQHWHDRADQISVDTGRQEKVGDGNPMTAWFDEVATVDEMEVAETYLGFHTFLFVFLGFGEAVHKEVEVLRKKFAVA